ncbi:MAG: hypothetical protein JNK79_09080 [Chitinophagaceae bacterium]|nr:hypothetical protein [Chitinophagaceae bacterium]
MHEPYEKRLNHRADFRVKYRFFSEEEGGRKSLPFQGYRSDFWCPLENQYPTSIYMIWPEFETGEGRLLMENNKPVFPTGTAKMWIIMPKTRGYLRDKICIGLKGYFMEGSRKVAECEVIEIIGLKTNPHESSPTN